MHDGRAVPRAPGRPVGVLVHHRRAVPRAPDRAVGVVVDARLSTVDALSTVGGVRLVGAVGFHHGFVRVVADVAAAVVHHRRATPIVRVVADVAAAVVHHRCAVAVPPVSCPRLSSLSGLRLRARRLEGLVRHLRDRRLGGPRLGRLRLREHVAAAFVMHDGRAVPRAPGRPVGVLVHHRRAVPRAPDRAVGVVVDARLSTVDALSTVGGVRLVGAVGFHHGFVRVVADVAAAVVHHRRATPIVRVVADVAAAVVHHRCAVAVPPVSCPRLSSLFAGPRCLLLVAALDGHTLDLQHLQSLGARLALLSLKGSHHCLTLHRLRPATGTGIAVTAQGPRQEERKGNEHRRHLGRCHPAKSLHASKNSFTMYGQG